MCVLEGVYVGCGQEKLGPMVFSLLWTFQAGSLIQVACLGRSKFSVPLNVMQGCTYTVILQYVYVCVCVRQGETDNKRK